MIMKKLFFVIVNLDCAITLFTPTEFGTKVFTAIDLFDQGKYEASGKLWEEKGKN